MTDVHDQKTRSRNMAAIKPGNTKPELLVRSHLHSLGFRYRIHDSRLPGKPDLVFPKYKAVIFVHGCFWHMHCCSLFKIPKTRTEWWIKKLNQNKKRDLLAQKELEELGWKVLTVWECAIRGRNKVNTSSLISSIAQWLTLGSSSSSIPSDITSH
ncbi:very short patch repair endonuclease [Marinobacterium aestuariivivens]|uniref:Very short patch repair endonuclease n=1 Tax=Marinobacterium aestuariivivens TaxID=1698799 RepID=A0ABW2A3A7_9GAMM